MQDVVFHTRKARVRGEPGVGTVILGAERVGSLPRNARLPRAADRATDKPTRPTDKRSDQARMRGTTQFKFERTV
jgi:hypothetical protein